MPETELTRAFGAFFAVMNPFVNLPFFLALTAGFTDGQRRALAVKVVAFSAIMCLVILLAGQAIISFFGISIDQFRVAGGFVLAQIAWSMLNGKGNSAHHGSQKEQGEMAELSSVAFYPMTFPMVVGPGTIATIIIYAGRAEHVRQLIGIGAILGAILALLFVALFFASQIGKVTSDTMRVITTRLMGMILLAISVEMIVDGAVALMPGLAGG